MFKSYCWIIRLAEHQLIDRLYDFEQSLDCIVRMMMSVDVSGVPETSNETLIKLMTNTAVLT